MISLERQHNPEIFLYSAGGNKPRIILQGIDLELKGNNSIVIDAHMSSNHTVILWADTEQEIVLELRPRKLTDTEKAKLHAAYGGKL